jgi:hypothetical protein
MALELRREIDKAQRHADRSGASAETATRAAKTKDRELAKLARQFESFSAEKRGEVKSVEDRAAACETRTPPPFCSMMPFGYTVLLTSVLRVCRSDSNTEAL